MAFPTNSILFINGEVCGINRFSANPDKNAPIIPSIPAISARTAPKKTITKTKIYWETPSSNRLKNQRPIIGKSSITINPKTRIETDNLTQNSAFTSPVVIPAITASTKRAKVSVIKVPPTVIFTALFFAIPILLIKGYAINV